MRWLGRHDKGEKLFRIHRELSIIRSVTSCEPAMASFGWHRRGYDLHRCGGQAIGPVMWCMVTVSRSSPLASVDMKSDHVRFGKVIP